MTKSVISVDYDTEVEQVWQLLIAHRVHAFPVIDKANYVLGIVSMDNFLSQIKTHQHTNIISQLTHFIMKSQTSDTNKAEYAGHLMIKPAITVNEKQSIFELFELFDKYKVHHLPVVNDTDKLVGMVTPQDLLRTFQNIAS
jgi:CBS domain-containing membrane protein